VLAVTICGSDSRLEIGIGFLNYRVEASVTPGKFTTILICLLALAGTWYWLQRGGGSKYFETDYSTESQSTLFQDVFGMAIPRGVDGLTIAGHFSFGGGRLWMKMRASDPAITAITSQSNPIDAKDFQYTIPDAGMGPENTLHIDATNASWDDVPLVPKPEVYLFRHDASDGHWIGNIVINRPKHLLYVSASLQQ
jgi:hypothetical protein